MTDIANVGEIAVSDIVQITDESHHWFPCLVVVSELKSFGIQGFVFIPHNDGKPAGEAYIRLTAGSFEKVGTAVIVPANHLQDQAE